MAQVVGDVPHGLLIVYLYIVDNASLVLPVDILLSRRHLLHWPSEQLVLFLGILLQVCVLVPLLLDLFLKTGSLCATFLPQDRICFWYHLHIPLNGAGEYPFSMRQRIYASIYGLASSSSRMPYVSRHHFKN